METVRRMEEFPQLSISELIAAVQYLPVGVSIVDRHLVAKFWNRAFLEILDFPEDLMRPGITLAELFRFNAMRGDYGPGDPEEQVRVRVELARKFEPHRFARTRKEGRILDITGSLIYDAGGEMIGFVTLYQDVTVEKRYERELEAKNRELQAAYNDLKQTQVELLYSAKMASVGHLAAGIAHEINNPIGFILSDHNALERDFDSLLALIDRYEALETHLPPGSLLGVRRAKSEAELDFIKEDTPSLFREIRQGLERVKEIVGHLRTFAHDCPGEWSNADLRELMDRALAVATNTFGERITVEKRYDDVVRLDCLASDLSQVFLGILTNAAQAIEAEGRISVGVHQENGEIIAEIVDTGKGIAAGDLPHIFDPFFTTREVGTGKGLGLAVAYNVIKKHGGSIDVRSAPNEGARFLIHLPLSHDLRQVA